MFWGLMGLGGRFRARMQAGLPIAHQPATKTCWRTLRYPGKLRPMTLCVLQQNTSVKLLIHIHI
ncbi:hypothetical protein Hanom_Chr00s000003g01603141 [Helianthus anomalus]